MRMDIVSMEQTSEAFASRMSFFPRLYHMQEGLAMAELDIAKLLPRDLCDYSNLISLRLKELKEMEMYLGDLTTGDALSHDEVEDAAKARREKNILRLRFQRAVGREPESPEEHFDRLLKERARLLDTLVMFRYDYEFALLRLCDRFEAAYITTKMPNSRIAKTQTSLITEHAQEKRSG